MARRKKNTTRPPWPLLATAVFCDRVLEAGEGAYSIINIRDGLTVIPGADWTPKQRIPVRMQAFISFRSGEVQGERVLGLALRRTGRRRKLIQEMPINFRGGQIATNVILTLDVRLKKDGLIWLDVLLDRKRQTSMPLTVTLQERLGPVGLPVQSKFAPADERKLNSGRSQES